MGLVDLCLGFLLVLVGKVLITNIILDVQNNFQDCAETAMQVLFRPRQQHIWRPVLGLTKF